MLIRPRPLFLARALYFVLSTTTSAAEAPGQPVPTSPENVRVSGDLQERMVRVVAYLDRASRQQLWSGFERLLTNDHSWGMWGADWPGRTLEAYARTSLCLGGAASRRFDEVGYGLLAHQSDEGAFLNGRSNSAYDKGNGWGHLCIETPDVYKACEDLARQGVKITRPPGPMKHGTRIIAFCEDPDGYSVELNESILNMQG